MPSLSQTSLIRWSPGAGTGAADDDGGAGIDGGASVVGDNGLAGDWSNLVAVVATDSFAAGLQVVDRVPERVASDNGASTPGPSA